MDKDEFFEFIKYYIQINSFEKTKRNEIEDYLKGNTNNIEVNANKLRFYTRDFEEGQNEIIKQLKTENRERAKRAFNIIRKLEPNMLLTFCVKLNERYEIYNEVQIDNDFVINDIIKTLNDFCKNYNGNYEDGYKSLVYDIYNPREKFKNPLSYLFKYYSNLIDNLLFADNINEPKIQMVKFILGALCIEKYKNEDKIQIYIEYTEKNIYGILKKIYGNNELEKDYNLYFDNNTYQEYFNNTCILDIFYARYFLKRITLFIAKTFRSYSSLIDNAFKILIIRISNDFYLKEYRKEDYTNIEQFYQEFKLPYRFNIDLYINQIFKPDFKEKGNILFQKLENILKQNKEEIFYCFNKFKEEKKIEFIILLVLLLKHQMISDEEKEDSLLLADDILINELYNMHQNSNKNLKFIYNNTSSSFEVLRNKDFNLKNVNLKIPYNINIETMISSSVLFYYSTVAKNIVCIFINSFASYGIKNNMNIFFKAMEGFSNLKFQNKYEEISKYMDFENLKKEDADIIINYVDFLYSQDTGMDYKCISGLLEHKLKTVINYMEDFFSDKEEKVRVYVKPLLKSKNRNTKEAVTRLLRLWDSEKTIQEINKIQNVQELTCYIEKMYNSENDKIIPYINYIDIGNVRIKNSEQKADNVIIKYYISEYMILKNLYIIKQCNKISEFLNKNDFRIVLKNIYNSWIDDGADTKKKNILLPYVLNCNEEDITQLKKQIDIWTENSRGALASFAVTAMSMKESDIALLIVDNIASKYKNKQVKNAAIEALKKTAQTLNITKEELGDRIVPNLGFDSNREKTFDYGNRKFKAILNDKMEISLYDEKEKLIKNLPKSNLSDNTELAENAKEELKVIKKQLKTVVATQKNRLENAMITGRKWTKEKWEKLFVQNPIMNKFAISLIWVERDENSNIIGTFRYMEDGSFNSHDEEEYKLKDNSFITILHPIDVSDNILNQWQQQLEDYEVIQPLDQIKIPVYKITDEEKSQDKINRFYGKEVYFGTIRGITEKYNWKKTSICDGGGYEGYYYEDEETKVGIQLKLEYPYVGMASDEKIKICEIEFYKKGSINYQGYDYNYIDDKNRIFPKDVSYKLMSFTLMVISAIVQKSI